MKKTRCFAILMAAIICCLSVFGCSGGGEKVMTLGRYGVSENLYSYWLSCYKTNFLYTYNGGVDRTELWSTILDEETGKTYADYVTEEIRQIVGFYLVGIKLFGDYGLKISSEVSADINSDIKEKIEYYGSRSELNEALSVYGLNVDLLKEAYIAEEKFQAVYDYLYGTNGIEKLTEEQIDDYYRRTYSRVQMIVVYTDAKVATDEQGNTLYNDQGEVLTEALSEEEKAEKQEKIRHVMAELNTGAKLEDLIPQYSDVDSSRYEHGLYVSHNDLVSFGTQLVLEVGDMEVGDIRCVEDTGVVFIVEKLETLNRGLFTACDKEQMYDLENYAIAEAYTKKFGEIAKDITYNEELLAQYSVVGAALNTLF